ncbi:3-isopropylmalate dehydrogenase [Sedimentibacter hydroxybenzoicus DSM 7310]|uniref:3-isopropylmalate dehydrogenase n=1 Tax=Sedimentibacter hydroxybenzoicus DSM 7310 TaxID=1123245 RepID=A0A974GX08_SEDHY|nr:3-isopropylmalate dehydrogenase [Sedimentibacter hydroxybenzoicus]NYB74605.1 3-isopropylmalate dehydrogenase [Sedimentibacter hydroxybenzoicus DSM 7310]
MDFKIAVIKGDGIGHEIIDETIKILNKIGKKYGHNFKYTEALAGGAAIDKTGTALPEETLNICRGTDALLFGAVGGPKWDNLPGRDRPEQGLLKLRKELGLYANLRPAVMFDELRRSCPLRGDIVEGGLDILIIRELTGGIYFGKKYTESDKAEDTMEYSRHEIERIAHIGFQTAQKRKGILTSVDKANVLETSRLWRKTFEEISPGYPDVTLNHMYVDNAAMQLVYNPKQFDVIATENMFGDILSDEAAMITGSIGLLPSAALGNNYGMYEPIHGSAPDIAGQGKANPIAAILSSAMMLKYSFNLPEEAENIENAVKKALAKGCRTSDIAMKNEKVSTTEEMGDIIALSL